MRQIKVWPCREMVETEAFFLTNVVGAADNTTVINHLSLQVFKFPNFVNLHDRLKKLDYEMLRGGVAQ